MTITRQSIQTDTLHGGTYNAIHTDKGIPYVKGTVANHSQKIQEDDTFYFEDDELDTSEFNTGKRVVATNVKIDNDLDVVRDEHIGQDLDVQGNVLIHGRDVHSDPDDPTSDLIPNVINEGTLEQQDKAHFLDTVEVEKKTTLHYDPTDTNKESLQVDGVSQFNDNVYINADLYVKGATYDTKVTDLNVGADHITVRDENNASMTAGESAGILINKYDGVDSLGIVASNDGTLRVGEYNITHVFTDDNTTYYAEKELINVVDVTGKTLYPIGDQTGTIKEKYFVAKDDTEPLATRDEEELMEDEYITKWNATDKNIVTSATNEARVVNSEIETKNDTARIYDLEHGKIDLQIDTSYPIQVTKTPSEIYTQVSAGLNTFVSGKLVRCEKGTADNTDFTYEYKSAVPFYLKSGSTPDFVYTVITHWKKEDSIYYYSTDNRTTWVSFNDPTIFYYQEGNGEATQYEIEQNPESVIRHFDTAQDYRDEVAATAAGTSENPLKVGNVIHIHDQLGIQTDVVGAQEILPVGAIGITDNVEEGNYDCVTSNAVAKALTGGQIHGTVEDSDLNMRANGRSVRNVSIGTTLPNTNYVVLATVTSGTNGLIVENASAVSTSSFKLTVRNLNSTDVSASFTVHWLIFQY